MKKISDVIARLETIRSEYGDVEVKVVEYESDAESEIVDIDSAISTDYYLTESTLDAVYWVVIGGEQW